ncbi:MAG: hypothetical protein ACXVEF_42045 [Polyangiales bacterium]
MKKALALALFFAGCAEAPRPSAQPAPSVATSIPAPAPTPSAIASAPAPAVSAAPTIRKDTGPFEMPFAEKRTVYWLAPHAPGKQRLMAMLHGVCNPPGYTCGLWADDAKDLGFLVCPTGNGSCGKAMYDAPTWSEPDTAIDGDLEASIAAVDKVVPGELARDEAILLGFSKGAYASVKIATAHPGRWPYLVLIEADAKVNADQLKKAGVRAVAFLAGEIGTQVAGEKKSVASLTAAGFPAKLWVMPKAGHHYSNDIGTLLREAVAWLDTH